MKKIKKKTVQEWIPIKEVFKDGIIKIDSKNYVKILEIIPINYNLKSDLEKEAILNSYKVFLKTCNFDIQILIQSNKEDLNHHISKINKVVSKKENKNLKKIALNYVNFISNLNINKKSASKKFYIVIKSQLIDKENSEEFIKQDLKEKYLKIKECLSRCGNKAFEINEKEKVLEIFYSFLNVKKFLNKKMDIKEG